MGMGRLSSANERRFEKSGRGLQLTVPLEFPSVTFLDHIFGRLEKTTDLVVLEELRSDPGVPKWGLTANELLAHISQARAFLAALGLKTGDRVAILGHNSIEFRSTPARPRLNSRP